MSSQPGFTPGPWKREKGSWWFIKTRYAFVAEVFKNNHKAEANSYLIAAAPELLLSLETLLIRAENMAALLRAEGYGLDDAHDLKPFEAARAALAKAKGG